MAPKFDLNFLGLDPSNRTLQLIGQGMNPKNGYDSLMDVDMDP